MSAGIMLIKPLSEITRREFDEIEFTFRTTIVSILQQMETDSEIGLDVSMQQDYVDDLIFMVDGISEYYARYNTVE